jgi:hypothetical protein
MKCEEILDRLKLLANPENVAGMARFGINPNNTYDPRIVKPTSFSRG